MANERDTCSECGAFAPYHLRRTCRALQEQAAASVPPEREVSPRERIALVLRERYLYWRKSGEANIPEALIVDMAAALLAAPAGTQPMEQIHDAPDLRECSSRLDGPNYVEQDGRDGQCRHAPHWRPSWKAEALVLRAQCEANARLNDKLATATARITALELLCREKDAAFSTAAEACRELCAEREQATARVGALEGYAAHRSTCPGWYVSVLPLANKCDCGLAALLQPEVPRAPGDVTCWLIERTDGPRPRWLAWRDRDAISWTPNAQEADRYDWSIAASREARLITATQGVACVAVEHMFLAPRAPGGA